MKRKYFAVVADDLGVFFEYAKNLGAEECVSGARTFLLDGNLYIYCNNLDLLAAYNYFAGLMLHGVLLYCKDVDVNILRFLQAKIRIPREM